MSEIITKKLIPDPIFLAEKSDIATKEETIIEQFCDYRLSDATNESVERKTAESEQNATLGVMNFIFLYSSNNLPRRFRFWEELTHLLQSGVQQQHRELVTMPMSLPISILREDNQERIF